MTPSCDRPYVLWCQPIPINAARADKDRNRAEPNAQAYNQSQGQPITRLIFARYLLWLDAEDKCLKQNHAAET